MIKNKFFKNLFITVITTASILLLYIPLIFGFIESLKYESNFGWLLLLMPIILIALYYIFGFYWIFQKVIIDEYGIKIIFIKKVIEDFKWEDIHKIELSCNTGMSQIEIELLDGQEINLDSRKSIYNVIKKYYPKEIDF